MFATDIYCHEDKHTRPEYHKNVHVPVKIYALSSSQASLYVANWVSTHQVLGHLCGAEGIHGRTAVQTSYARVNFGYVKKDDSQGLAYCQRWGQKYFGDILFV